MSHRANRWKRPRKRTRASVEYIDPTTESFSVCSWPIKGKKRKRNPQIFSTHTMTALSRKVLDQTEVALFASTFEPILLLRGILLVYELKQANARPKRKVKENNRQYNGRWNGLDIVRGHNKSPHHQRPY